MENRLKRDVIGGRGIFFSLQIIYQKTIKYVYSYILFNYGSIAYYILYTVYIYIYIYTSMYTNQFVKIITTL